MTGNVWEWADGWYNFHDAAPAAQERKFRVLRGGAWNSDEWKMRTTYRMAYKGDFRFAANGGFRCVAS
jgi:iron(II)-dependent oxidoreductase